MVKNRKKKDNQTTLKRIVENLHDGMRVKRDYHFALRKKHMQKIPTDWYEAYQVLNFQTKRGSSILKCVYKECNTYFKGSGNFKDHIRIHDDTRPFDCAICGVSFS